MHNTIGALLSGKPVETWYRKCDEKWSDLIAKHGTGERLIRAIDGAQIDFELICGGDIAAGKEIMAITGVAHYYDHENGFLDAAGRAKSREVYDAIRNSSCSMEVHQMADWAAGMFNLIDDEEINEQA